jgi:hypothetical protein
VNRDEEKLLSCCIQESGRPRLRESALKRRVWRHDSLLFTGIGSRSGSKQDQSITTVRTSDATEVVPSSLGSPARRSDMQFSLHSYPFYFIHL